MKKRKNTQDFDFSSISVEGFPITSTIHIDGSLERDDLNFTSFSHLVAKMNKNIKFKGFGIDLI
jgi:hypothetical protein